MSNESINTMHRYFGSCMRMKSQCKECPHLESIKLHGREYFKCAMYGDDILWRPTYPACSLCAKGNIIPGKTMPTVMQYQRERGIV